MKVLKYFLCMWLVVMAQTFISCSEDDPINEEQGAGQGESEEDEENGNDEEEVDDEGAEESLYKPYITDKRVSKLVVERIRKIYGIKDFSYYHYQFSYDKKGRISEELYFSQFDGKEPSDTIVTKFTYSGNTIYMQYNHLTNNSISDNDITLNSLGYVSGLEYDKDGYLVGYFMSGYNDGNCQVRWEKGNLISESKPVDSYSCTYTDYLNDTSLDLTSFLIRSAEMRGNISVPCDTKGKRSVNLPKVRKITHSANNIQRNYTYEFDSQGRVSEISITGGGNERVIYYLKYEN